MKCVQILGYRRANILKCFLAQYWRLETSSRPCYNFIKWQYNEIFWFLVVNSYHFNRPSSPFENGEKLEICRIWSLSNQVFKLIGRRHGLLMKFDQFMSYSERNNFIKKFYKYAPWKLVPGTFVFTKN